MSLVAFESQTLSLAFTANIEDRAAVVQVSLAGRKQAGTLGERTVLQQTAIGDTSEQPRSSEKQAEWIVPRMANPVSDPPLALAIAQEGNWLS